MFIPKFAAGKHSIFNQSKLRTWVWSKTDGILCSKLGYITWKWAQISSKVDAVRTLRLDENRNFHSLNFLKSAEAAKKQECFQSLKKTRKIFVIFAVNNTEHLLNENLVIFRGQFLYVCTWCLQNFHEKCQNVSIFPRCDFFWLNKKKVNRKLFASEMSCACLTVGYRQSEFQHHVTFLDLWNQQLWEIRIFPDLSIAQWEKNIRRRKKNRFWR